LQQLRYKSLKKNDTKILCAYLNYHNPPNKSMNDKVSFTLWDNELTTAAHDEYCG